MSCRVMPSDTEACIQAGYVLHLFLFSYALQLLSPAKVNAEMQGRDKVEASDVALVQDLFLDTKTSAKIITRSNAKFIA